MTSKFDQTASDGKEAKTFEKNAADTDSVKKVTVEKLTHNALDAANEAMTGEVLSDIAQARMNAIRGAQTHKPTSVLQHGLSRILEWIRYDFLVNNARLAAPLAVAVVVTVLVSYNQNDTVPAIPAEFLTGDVPTEELAMLEDLEFASWLAEQQQEGLL